MGVKRKYTRRQKISRRGGSSNHSNNSSNSSKKKIKTLTFSKRQKGPTDRPILQTKRRTPNRRRPSLTPTVPIGVNIESKSQNHARIAKLHGARQLM